MEVLQFEVSGITAFFKSPCVNSSNGDMWFSFPHIHKVAVAGIVGALTGKGGYRGWEHGKAYPEFWEKFKDMGLAVVPSKPIFKRRMMDCTNTTGFANQMAKFGMGMIYKEQWLAGTKSDPLKWTLYIRNDEDGYFNEIRDAVMGNNTVFMPYLGNNHHFCDIGNARIVPVRPAGGTHIDSLFIKKDGVVIEEPERRGKHTYIQYKAPEGLEEGTGLYSYGQFILTNRAVHGVDIYTDGRKAITFI